MTAGSVWDEIRAAAESLEQAAALYRERVCSARSSGLASEVQSFDEWMGVTRWLLAQGRQDEAAATLDVVAGLFADSTDSKVMAKAVEAQVSAALLAEQMGDLSAAIERAQAVLGKHDAAIADPQMRRSLCYAMQRLYELQSRTDPETEDGLRSAVETIAGMVDEFAEDADLEIATPVAEALSNLVEMSLKLKDSDSARAALAEIRARYADAGGDRMKQIVRIARVREALLDSIPMRKKLIDPDGVFHKQGQLSDQRYVITMPWVAAERECVRAWLAWAKAKIEGGECSVPTPEAQWSEDAETVSTLEELDATFSERMGVFKSRYEKLAMADQAACELVDRYRNWGFPFVLYLRSFETSDLYRVVPRDDKNTRWAQPAFDPPCRTWYCLDSGQSSRMLHDAAILQFLREYTSVVFATNSFGGGMGVRVEPSLLFPDNEWQEPVHALIRHAELVVIRVVVESPSILEELEMVRTLDKTDQTIVVLADESEARALVDAQNVAAKSLGIDLSERKVVTTDHPALAGMQLCHDEDLIAGELEVFRAPFTRIRKLTDLDPVARLQSYAERLGA